MLLLSLSIDGKILMESYGSFLGFVRRSLCEVFKKYKLITAIRVLDRWINYRENQRQIFRGGISRR